VESPGEIDINGQNLLLCGKLHAKKSVNITVTDTVTLDKPGARIFSQGSLVIENPNHEPIKSMQISSSSIEVGGNATIKINYLLLQRYGGYKLEDQPIQTPSRHDCTKEKCWWGLSCYKETIGNLGFEPKLLIGGSLTFAGNKIDNNLGKFEVAGEKTYLGPDPEIHNEQLELKIVASFYSGGSHGGWPAVSAQRIRAAASEYCGVDTGGVGGDDISDFFGLFRGSVRHSKSKSYNVISSITMGQNTNVQNEIEATNIEEVTIQAIDITLEEDNHAQRPFVDQNLADLASANKVYTNGHNTKTAFDFNFLNQELPFDFAQYFNTSYSEFDCLETANLEGVSWYASYSNGDKVKQFVKDHSQVCWLATFGSIIGTAAILTGGIGGVPVGLAVGLLGPTLCAVGHHLPDDINKFIANDRPISFPIVAAGMSGAMALISHNPYVIGYAASSIIGTQLY
jgi:hypothetical protein